MYLIDKSKCAEVFHRTIKIELIKTILDTLNLSGRRISVCNHSIRVGYRMVQYAIKHGTNEFGYDLKWSEDELTLIMATGLLHDCGKDVSPLELLERKGLLTADEFRIHILPHPVRSAKLTEHFRTAKLSYDLRLLPDCVEGHLNWKKIGRYPNPFPKSIRELVINSDEWKIAWIQQYACLADFSDAFVTRTDRAKQSNDVDIAGVVTKFFSGETEVFGFAVQDIGLTLALRVV